MWFINHLKKGNSMSNLSVCNSFSRYWRHQQSKLRSPRGGYGGLLYISQPLYKAAIINPSSTKLVQPPELTHCFQQDHRFCQLPLCPSSPFWFEDISMDEMNFRQWVQKHPGHPEFGLGLTRYWSSRTRFLLPGCPSRTFPCSSITAKVSISLTTILMWSWRWRFDGRSLKNYEALHTRTCKNSTSWWFFMIQMTSTWMVRQKDSFTESVRDRYSATGWHTALVEDGTDLGNPVRLSKRPKLRKPSLIEVKTVGYGFSKQTGTNAYTVLLLNPGRWNCSNSPNSWLGLWAIWNSEQSLCWFRNVADRGASAYQAWTI